MRVLFSPGGGNVSGFNGYSSMMMVDHVENNPIRVVFLDLLIRGSSGVAILFAE